MGFGDADRRPRRYPLRPVRRCSQPGADRSGGPEVGGGIALGGRLVDEPYRYALGSRMKKQDREGRNEKGQRTRGPPPSR